MLLYHELPPNDSQGMMATYVSGGCMLADSRYETQFKLCGRCGFQARISQIWCDITRLFGIVDCLPSTCSVLALHNALEVASPRHLLIWLCVCVCACVCVCVSIGGLQVLLPFLRTLLQHPFRSTAKRASVANSRAILQDGIQV